MPSMRVLGSRVVLACIVVFASCGDSKSEGQGTTLLRAVCEFAVRCQVEADVGKCLAAQTEPARIDASIAAGRIRVDSTIANNCLGLFRRAPCTVGTIEMFEEVCNDLFIGTVKVGDACFSENDCADRGPCFIDDPLNLACRPGECGSPVPRPTIPPKVAPGQPCSDRDECPAGTACASMDGTPTRCLPLVADGQSCEDVPCSGLSSDCDRSDRICKPQATLGQSCTNVECRQYLQCVAGVCQTRPALGEACTVPTPPTVGSEPCTRGRCTGGSCQEPACMPAGS
jgi:hypothetical protein